MVFLCVQLGATFYFVSFLVIASQIVMALFMAAVSEYVSYDLLASDTAMVSVDHLAAFQVHPFKQAQNSAWHRMRTRFSEKHRQRHQVQCLFIR